MSKSDIAVSVRGLSKSYTIVHNQEKERDLTVAMLKRLKNPFHRPAKETFWALKDVSFDIKKGDVVGIIGRNGAGKSTLLKILSRITEPTTGRIDLYGRVGSLLEVGTGFHPELTGRENVYLNGAILGMTRGEINKQFDAIVDFAGVEQFLDTPVKRYSSGMYVRLAFAVAAHLSSDILIVDEVLAVGDAEFQDRCLNKMRDVSSHGRTIFFVSHNISAIRFLCRRALLLSGGRVLSDGSASDVCDQYSGKGTESQHKFIPADTHRLGSGEIRTEAIRLRTITGHPLSTVTYGVPFDIQIDYNAKKLVRRVNIGVDIDSFEGRRITTLYSGFLNQSFDVGPGRGSFLCRINALPLRPDKYDINVFVGDSYGIVDFIKGVFTLDFSPSDVFGTGTAPSREHGATISNFSWRVGTEASAEPGTIPPLIDVGST